MSTSSIDILPYTPSLPGAVVFICLNLVIAIGASIHIRRHHSKYALCLPIGAAFITIGWAVRIGFRGNLTSIPLYAVQYLLIVCMPACFFAINYIFAARFIKTQRQLLPQPPPQLSIVSERLLARIFIISDITTFLIQMGGGGLQASQNQSTAKTGSNIFLAGVVIQGSFYVFFTVTCAIAHYRLVRFTGNARAGLPFFAYLYLSSLPLFMRTGFRITEGVDGRSGPTFEQEWFTFVFDSLPLFLSMIIWIIRWPDRWFVAKEEEITEMQTCSISPAEKP